ncbi:MAG: hypothetical protein D6768_02290 [Chloroflexi bacterium]|nr:MAG: hypothetical protein D6768_02290 [Chloroflexota bacterium]
MVANVFRGPHSLYRRYQALLERTATAAGFALVVALALKGMAVYPDNWVVVLGIGIAVLGLRWPLAAYGAAVVAMTYPIFTINFYLAVLFVAVAALGYRHFVHFLGATALVLATPLLAQYHLHWLVPVLGGLWWGGVAGAWIGGLAAVWGKLIGGMAGMNTDWLLLAGHTPQAQAIAERFQDANSLNTLLLLVEPFAASSVVLLYNLLQVAGWILAGAFVGGLSSRRWVKYHAPWSVLVVTAGGGLILLAAHVALPYWLVDAAAESGALLDYDPSAPLFSLVVVILVGTLVYTLRESLDLPVAPRRVLRRAGANRQPVMARATPAFSLFKRSAKIKTGASEQSEDLGQPRRPVRVPSQHELPEWEPPQTDSGLIMLEID